MRFSRVKHKELIVNYDATQLFLAPCSLDNTDVILADVHRSSQHKSTSQVVNSTPLPNCVKYFAIISSAGLMCPKAVFLLVDYKLASDEFYRY